MVPEPEIRSWSAGMDHSADLMRALLTRIKDYLSNDGSLNSDGRRLLRDIVREIAKNRRALMRLAKKVRKEPTLENVMRLARELLREEADELLAASLWGLGEGIAEERSNK